MSLGRHKPSDPPGLGHWQIRDSVDAGRRIRCLAAGALGRLQGPGMADVAVPWVAEGGRATGGSTADPSDPGGPRERQEHPTARVVSGEAQQQDTAAGF